MDLKQLEYFVAVVDLGGFSRASRLLGIAQPAISRQVRSLEVELRQSLLRRNGRGALPTEAGKRLLDHARSILQQVERARREVDEVKGAPVGHVVIGLPPTLALALTATIVREFRRRFPRASVSIVEGLSVHIHDWVVVGRADVGVLYNPVPSAAVEIRPLVDEQLCLVSRRAPRRQAASVKLRDLPAYPLIIPSRPNAIRALVDARLATLGIAVLSPRAIEASDAGRQLVARPIVRPPLTTTLAIVASAQRPSTPVQDAAIALIESLLPRVAA
jgi:LysR family nitrogen assimilation transcriptional regulator